MTNKVSVIIFTYKRAMLLHNCLETLLKNFKNLDYPIYVIYHFDKKHKQSYLKLQNFFKKKKIIFIKRKNLNFFKVIFKAFRLLNIIWLIRWPIMIKKMNSFKFQLEEILNNIKSEYVSLCPDDMIFFDSTKIDKQALNLIKKNKKNYQYRYFTSNKFKKPHNLPQNLKIKNYKLKKNNSFFSWSFKDKFAKGVWKYRFTIEGTIYSRSILLKFLKPFLYHNPITLEAIGLWESRIRDFFFKGLSSMNRTAATYQINNVQNLVNTPSANFNTELLMRAYNDGYKLLYNKGDFKKNYHDTTPNNLFFYKKNKVKKISYDDLRNKYK